MFKVKAVGSQTLDEFGIDLQDGQEVDLLANAGGADPELSFEVYAKLKAGYLIRLPDDDQLAILRYVKDEGEVINTDFTLLGLEASPWAFHRGARTLRQYKNADGKLIVEDHYGYEYKDYLREITKVIRTIKWYTEGGEVGLTKDASVKMTKKKTKQLNREIRQGRMDFLETSAEELREYAGLVAEPAKTQYNQVADSIDLLHEHYATEEIQYISRGTMAFENAVVTETYPPMLVIHAVPTAPPSLLFPTGLTIKTTILYQLRGYLVTEGDVHP